MITKEVLNKKTVLRDSTNLSFKLSIATNNPVLVKFLDEEICEYITLDALSIQNELQKSDLKLEKS